MRNLKFHSVRAYNFICFGPEGIHIDFDKLGNIVFIKGENKDVKPIDNSLPNEEVKISNNGSGKSSCLEILIYGLYGKTIKKSSAIGVNGVIHNLVNKDCRVEVEWDNYKLIRTRSSKNTLRLWKSEKHIWDDSTEITTGSIVETQKVIEDILGLSYEAFVNISVFTDDQSICFLEASGPVKREIVENLLSLSVYRERQEKANSLIKETKTAINILSKEFDILQNNKLDSERRLNQTIQKEKNWQQTKKQEYADLLKKIESKTEVLKNTDQGKDLLIYQQAKIRIQEIQSEITSYESNQEILKTQIKTGKEKEDKLKEQARTIRDESENIKREFNDIQKKINDRKNHIVSLEKNEHGAICEYCCGTVDQKNYYQVIENEQKEIDILNKNLLETKERTDKLIEQAKNNTINQNKLKELLEPKSKTFNDVEILLKNLRNELVTKAQIREPKADSTELLLQQEIDQLHKLLKSKKEEIDGKSPYEEIIENDKEELKNSSKICEDKEIQVKALEGKLPYFQYWNTGFGEKGIRKYIIDGIIPQLNNRIAYWLQFLIDNKITLTFDNELNEKIERNPPDGNPYIYHALSAGQRRRLNLAVSQAFADIMMLSSGSIPSLVFLDEVSTNIDANGIFGLFSMIQELSNEKQVFVTTHDHNMMRMLQSYDTIDLVHENGFTTIK